MEKFKDKNGNFINVGDVLIYNEGDGYSQSIEEVVEHDGELAGIMRVGEMKWTVLKNQEPIPLRFYKVYPSHSDNTTIHAAIADVPHDKAFTIDFAVSHFCSQKQKRLESEDQE